MDENPYLWWQHAGQAVLGERSLTLATETSRWGLRHRRYYRQLYCLYYLRHRSWLYWLLDLLSGCPNASRDALVQLEAQLGDGEIAQFRWWVWASQWAALRRRGRVSDVPEYFVWGNTYLPFTSNSTLCSHYGLLNLYAAIRLVFRVLRFVAKACNNR